MIVTSSELYHKFKTRSYFNAISILTTSFITEHLQLVKKGYSTIIFTNFEIGDCLYIFQK